MTTLYYSDDSVTLHHGDALAVLTGLPSGSVDCCVTSPPYFGLRDYGVAGQMGAESSPAEYVEGMRAVFAEVRRVLADDGTLWLNIGDSYSAGYKETRMPPLGASVTRESKGGFKGQSGLTKSASDVPAKNLLGIPWRTAFALQDDGWILRNDNIWAKPNGMPESVTDRLSSKHEYVFMFAKSPRYWFDLDPIREAASTTSASALNWARDTKECDVPWQGYRQHRLDRVGAGKRPELLGRQPQSIEFGGTHDAVHLAGKNPGDVWTIPTSPFPEAHFAVMAPALAERCILAGCKPGGVVLDPFSGVGTTGMVAAKHGRRYVGIELNAETLDLSLRTRLAQPGLAWEGEPA